MIQPMHDLKQAIEEMGGPEQALQFIRHYYGFPLRRVKELNVNLHRDGKYMVTDGRRVLSGPLSFGTAMKELELWRVALDLPEPSRVKFDFRYSDEEDE